MQGCGASGSLEAFPACKWGCLGVVLLGGPPALEKMKEARGGFGWSRREDAEACSLLFCCNLRSLSGCRALRPSPTSTLTTRGEAWRRAPPKGWCPGSPAPGQDQLLDCTSQPLRLNRRSAWERLGSAGTLTSDSRFRFCPDWFSLGPIVLRLEPASEPPGRLVKT